IGKPAPLAFHTYILNGYTWLDEVLNGHPDRMHNQLGMSAGLLWADLVATSGLCDSRYV
ncbi:hypothetical protein C8F01DRAFT_935026, partial [Mycena amicta]